MKSTESELIKRFSADYLSVMIDNIISELDQLPPAELQGGASTNLASVWEEICVQVQGDYFDVWDSYLNRIMDISYAVVEKEKPAVLDLLAFSARLAMEVDFCNEENRVIEIVEYIFDLLIEKAESEDRPAIQQFLDAEKNKADQISTFKAQFESEAEAVANKIIQQIEEGAGTWEMPWHKGMSFALNRVTGSMYGGMNLIRLWNECRSQKYKRNHWATLKQWRKMGGMVKKGSNSTKIAVVFQRKILKDKNQLVIDSLPASAYFYKTGIRYISVFNVDQVSGLYFEQPDLFSELTNDLSTIETLIKRSGAEIRHGGDRAFYRPSQDFIQMPHRVNFKDLKGFTSEEAYYTTLLHELIHWTGHKSRCKRSNYINDDKVRYAFEELVAELGCAMLSTHFQKRVYPRPEHAQYIDSWLKVLKKDFKYFYQAQNQALIAINWLFLKTEVLPFQIKERQTTEINEDRFNEWDAISDTNSQNIDNELFYESNGNKL